jgi:hypothetical protein
MLTCECKYSSTKNYKRSVLKYIDVEKERKPEPATCSNRAAKRITINRSS